MSVTVDHQPLAAERMGFQTVGEVLTHVQRGSKLVVHVLVDGEEPDLERLSLVRQIPLRGHTLFVETADPGEMASEVLEAVQEQLRETDPLREQCAELLRAGDCAAAMEKLSRCFSIWQHAQESVLKTAQLLRLDLDEVSADGVMLRELVEGFARQLREIRSALENRDYVLLSDILGYEMRDSTAQWRAAIDAMRMKVAS